MAGHDGKIPLPEDYKDNIFEASNRYRLSVQKVAAPTAISITNLDKWFIPGVETCDIRYTLEGDSARGLYPGDLAGIVRPKLEWRTERIEGVGTKAPDSGALAIAGKKASS